MECTQENGKHLCRVCMDSSLTLIEIFSKQQVTDLCYPALPDMINNVLEENYQVKQDALPQHICLDCVLAAENAFHFKQRCQQSFSHFCQLLKGQRIEDAENPVGLRKEAKETDIHVTKNMVASCQFVQGEENTDKNLE
ncbi:uncharacterized protein Dwil_GK27270 [Drosophila willistoni]|uniref:ZAD domain-containing protein n=1 Tax=Drosophila willistoni TaxID=7260 RepID=A0A0Q9WS01_DROWI|nr:uncharacterized protein Dwil_GK27270 [Drosophila willistoni]